MAEKLVEQNCVKKRRLSMGQIEEVARDNYRLRVCMMGGRFHRWIFSSRLQRAGVAECRLQMGDLLVEYSFGFCYCACHLRISCLNS